MRKIVQTVYKLTLKEKINLIDASRTHSQRQYY